MSKRNRKHTSHKDEFVKATNLDTQEVKFFRNGVEASVEIGCSRVLVYRALAKKSKDACGWKLEYIGKDDPQWIDFKGEIDERIKTQRKSLLDCIHYEERKAKEVTRGEKA